MSFWRSRPRTWKNCRRDTSSADDLICLLCIKWIENINLYVGVNYEWSSHLFLRAPLTSNPLMKMLLFFDSDKMSFKLSWATTCFLKFCMILAPRSFLSLSLLMIDSKSRFLRYWLTLSLKFMDLSNYSKLPLLSSAWGWFYFWRNRRWLSFWSSRSACRALCCSLSPKTRWTLSYPNRRGPPLRRIYCTFYEICHFVSIFTQAESDEGILELLDAYRPRSCLVERFEVFPQF